jgi:multiple sugar transport system permease protein
MSPYLALFTLLIVIPILGSVVLSFTYFNMLEMPEWRGWDNYVRLFLDDDVFIIAIKNTLVFGLITGPISYGLCLLFAWLINELPPKIRAFMTLVFYAPSISANVYMIWSFIFSGDAYGLVNGFLMKMGLIHEPIQWLINPDYNLKILILIQLWLSLGTSFLAFIAGLQSIDRNLYEAGAIDGMKNRWQELWYITLPAMKPQLLFGAVMQISISFAVSDLTMALAGFPSTNYSARTIVTHIVDYGTLRFEMGYASAIAVFLFITMIFCKKVIWSLLDKVG